MNILLVLKSEIRRSPLAMLALAILLALALSLGLGLSMLERGLRQGYAKAGDDFDIVIGARGSKTDLMLASAYLQAYPLNTIAYDYVVQLQKQSGLSYVAPLIFGDRYKDYPLIGTTADFLSLGGKRKLAQGREFQDHNEAVIGALVKLDLGSSFKPAHGAAGIEEEHIHENSGFIVTGRLPYSGTPYDQAILVPVEAVWEAHGLEQGGVSAVVIKPVNLAEAYKIRAKWQNNDIMTIFSGEVLTELFAVLGDVRQIMQYLAALTQVIALGAVIMASIFAVALRRNLLNLLQTLGAPRRYLIMCIWSLLSANIVLGSLLGLCTGLGLAHLGAWLIQTQTATWLPISISSKEIYLTLIFISTGLICALIPAFARRK